MIYVLGCDPGKTGAIVGVTNDGKLTILRTPHMASAKGRGEEILYGQMWETFEKMFMLSDRSGWVPQHVFIERVQAMPQQGGSSMFKFGYSAGFLRGVITAARIPYDMIEPQAWKKTARLPAKAEKEQSIPRACELWPAYTEQLTPKRGHWDKEACIGVADAALIGYHGLSLLGAAPVSFRADPANEFDI
jgi:crossover junction endodeoxyribonuclease RuvC